jgi:two-component system cell cycle response regulator
MNAHVLVIDDSATVRYKLKQELESRGFSIDMARNGREALDMLHPGHRYDVIITDLMMPGLDGEKLIVTLQKCEEKGELSSTPIIVLTAVDEKDSHIRNLEAGAAAYITKPWDDDLLVATVRRLAKIKSRQSELEHDSRTDALTGLCNRGYGRERLEQLIARHRRHPIRLSVALLDIDHFKLVNDTQGHAGGDDVLRHVSAELRSISRETDLVVRWGGEEFLFVFLDSDLAQAAGIVERFRAHLAEHPVHLQAVDCEIPITISGGVAELEPQDTVDELVARADEALYKAKELGRNRLITSQLGQLLPVEAS